MPEENLRCGMQMDEAVDPFALFSKWMDDAKVSELNDPNAMSLATATPEGVPSVRIVLCKGYDARGFKFYTNGESRKGGELKCQPRMPRCASTGRAGSGRCASKAGSRSCRPKTRDAYFKRRARMSQIGAWASQQSRPLESREVLMARTEEIEKRFPDEVPRPPYWTGFLVAPHAIEFWQEGDYRLHDRFVFTHDGPGLESGLEASAAVPLAARPAPRL